MYAESDNTTDFTYKARSESRDNEYRFRSPKAARSNRRKTSAPCPGSARLRRNKHWNW
jgi:hypothetical protein